MSEPFTITRDNWRQADKLEELHRAASEREAVWSDRQNSFLIYFCQEWEEGGVKHYHTGWGVHPDQGYHSLFPITEGIGQSENPIIQSAEFFSGMQLVRQGHYDAGVPWYIGDAGNLDTPDWWAAASAENGGVNFVDYENYGYRRCTEMDAEGNPVFQFGKMEPGDIIGYWIIEDLLTSFKHMTKFRPESSSTSFSATRFSSGQMEPVSSSDPEVSGPDYEATYALLKGNITSEPVENYDPDGAGAMGVGQAVLGMYWLDVGWVPPMNWYPPEGWTPPPGWIYEEPESGDEVLEWYMFVNVLTDITHFELRGLEYTKIQTCVPNFSCIGAGAGGYGGVSLEIYTVNFPENFSDEWWDSFNIPPYDRYSRQGTVDYDIETNLFYVSTPLWNLPGMTKADTSTNYFANYNFANA